MLLVLLPLQLLQCRRVLLLLLCLHQPLQHSMRRPVQTLMHRISKTPATPGSPRSCKPNRR